MEPATQPSPIAALVLAGGRATRMGGADKPLLPLGGKPLMAHVLARLEAPGRPLAISANGDAARFDAFGLPVLADADASFAGPLAGVLAGLIWAQALGATRLVTAPADCPFLPPDLVQRLCAGPATRMAHARAGGRDHPVIACWPVSLRAPLESWLARGERRVMGFLAHVGTRGVEWPEASAFANINTPEELAGAQARLAQAPNT